MHDMLIFKINKILFLLSYACYAQILMFQHFLLKYACLKLCANFKAFRLIIFQQFVSSTYAMKSPLTLCALKKSF